MTSKSEYVERFMRKVEKIPSGCWQWTGAIDPVTGYGKFWYAGQCWQAHRCSVRLFTRRAISAPGTFDYSSTNFACHTCDNRWCVNPKHVFLSSQRVNIADMIQKGRQVIVPKPGEKNGRCKLKDDQILTMRSLYELGEYNQKELAQMFGIGTSQANRILRKMVR